MGDVAGKLSDAPTLRASKSAVFEAPFRGICSLSFILHWIKGKMVCCSAVHHSLPLCVCLLSLPHRKVCAPRKEFFFFWRNLPGETLCSHPYSLYRCVPLGGLFPSALPTNFLCPFSPLLMPCQWMVFWAIGFSKSVSSRPTPRRQQDEGPSSLSRHWKVLVVDDNRINQRVLQSMLQSLLRENCVGVDTAVNGKQALDLFVEAARSSSWFHLVLMDCQMPVMVRMGECSCVCVRGIMQRSGEHHIEFL